MLVNIQNQVDYITRLKFFEKGLRLVRKKLADGASIESILNTLVSTIEEHLPGHIGAIWVLEENKQCLRIGSGRKLPTKYMQAMDDFLFDPQAPFCGNTLSIGKLVAVEDITTNAYWKSYQEIALKANIRACWSYPIFCSKNHLLGTFALYFKQPKKLSKDELNLLGTAAEIAGLAIEMKRDAEALKVSQKRYQLVVESTNDGLYDLDLIRNKVYWNDRYFEMLGFQPQSFEVTFEKFVELLDPKDRDLTVKTIQSYMQNPGNYEAEVRLRHQDGHYLTVLCCGGALFDHDRPIRLLGLARNITVQKQVEVSLAYQNQLTKTLSENAAVALFMMDAEGRVTYMNPAAESMSGFLFEELKGKILHDHMHCIGPEGISSPLSECPIVQTVFTLGRLINHEDVFNRKDGSLFPILCSASAIWKGAELNGFILEVQDITERKQSEALLKESEERFRTLADQAPIIIYIVEPYSDAKISYINQYWLDYTGQSFEEALSSQQWDSIIHPDDFESVRKSYLLAFNAQQPYMFEARLKRHDGEYRWFMWKGDPRVLPTGKFVGFIGTGLDIHERKLAEVALEESEAQFRAIADASPALIWKTNSKGQVIYFSKPFLKFLGLPHDYQGIIPWESYVPKDELPGIEAALAESIQQHKPLSIEHHIRRADGEIRWLLVAGTVLYSINGEFQGLIGSNMDITERKQVEHDLAESEERYRLVLHGSNDGIWDWNLVSGNIYWNERLYEMLGLSPENFAPTSDRFFALVHPDDMASIDRLLKAHFADPSVKYEIQYRVRHSDGHYLTTLAKGEAHLNAEGEPVRMTGVNTDITAMQNAKEAMEEYARKLEYSNKELEQFALITSHDLQEPLRKIMIFSQYLQNTQGNTLTEESQDYLIRMQHAAVRMQALITDLLDLSRVNRKGQPFRTINLNTVIQDVLSDLYFTIRDGQGQIEVEPMMTLDADDKQMHQLFQNLIGNALKFHKEGVPPVVKISMRKENHNMCQIQVTDNGIGFDEKYCEQVFGIFERLHGRSAYAGTGVGLAICQKIVERHGGRISASSHPGQGSTFTVLLPIKHNF